MFKAIAFLAMAAAAARADVSVSAPFGEHMVLQRGMPAPLWGKAAAGESLSVAFRSKTVAAVGEANNPHPPDKWDIGHRLALCARARQYGETGLGYQAPMYESMRIEGKTIRLFFRHAVGLAPKAGTKISGFAIAGADGKWAWADAVIAKDTVIVSAAAVAAQTQVRYGWGQNPR